MRCWLMLISKVSTDDDLQFDQTTCAVDGVGGVGVGSAGRSGGRGCDGALPGDDGARAGMVGVPVPRCGGLRGLVAGAGMAAVRAEDKVHYAERMEDAMTMRQWRLVIDGEDVGDASAPREPYREPERPRRAQVGGLTRRQRVDWLILGAGAVIDVGLSVAGLARFGLTWQVPFSGLCALVIILIGLRLIR